MRTDYPGPFARHALGVSLMLIALLSATGTGLAQTAQHPLDPLGWEEHWIVLDAIVSAGHSTDSTRYALVTLKEPDKGPVAAWSPGEPFAREAFAIVMEGTKTFEAVVDLEAETVASWKEVAGVQANWLEEEFGVSAGIALENEEFREALQRRGYSDVSRIECFGLPLGYFGTPRERGRRLATVECVDTWRARNTFPRLIGGLEALVDMDTGEVIEVKEGEIVPVAAVNADFDAASIGRTRDTGAPISMEQPLGPGFEMDGHTVRWQKWTFHHRSGRALLRVELPRRRRIQRGRTRRPDGTRTRLSRQLRLLRHDRGGRRREARGEAQRLLSVREVCGRCRLAEALRQPHGEPAEA
jgi:primary-amine oxidase